MAPLCSIVSWRLNWYDFYGYRQPKSLRLEDPFPRWLLHPMNSTVARMQKYGLNQTAKLNANIISLALHLRLGYCSLSASGLHQQVFPVNKVKSSVSKATYHHISCATVAEATTYSAEVPGKETETLSMEGVLKNLWKCFKISTPHHFKYLHENLSLMNR